MSAKALLIVVTVGFGVAGLTLADTHEAQLQRLRARIDKLQRELNVTVGKRDSARDELHAQERRISAFAQTLRDIDSRLDGQMRALADLRQREHRERAARHAQIHALEAQIRAAYALGQQPYLKVVLGQENPAAASRVLTYYHYVARARLARIDEAATTLKRLEELQTAIGERTHELSELRAAQDGSRRALEASRQRRAELLATLNRQVANRSEEIERLRTDEQRLERLVRELKTVLPEADVSFPRGNQRFAALRGRLPLPLVGRITAHYGQPKGVGKLTWRGIFVEGKEGQTVHAISRGRVAYADWLRGFGLLLILDHGDGYMTLYGHNETLAAQTGDWVEAGQAIATVGNTGDAPDTGVYFEIRQNGIPQDPLRWCMAGQTSASRARR